MSETIKSINPADGSVVWEGPAATQHQVDAAMAAASAALPGWRDTSFDDRVAALRRFAEVAAGRIEDVAQVISRETGKTLWESRTEAKLLGAKVDATLEAWGQRRGEATLAMGAATAVTRYAPIGVMVILGPFNFPAHLPNGHAVPALLAGNTVVFKPSEKTPGTGELFVELWEKAGLPAGVLQVVQGGRETAQQLVNHVETAGVLFTGSYRAGQAISRALADRPEVILALEMGGNNPLVVHDPEDPDAAAHQAVMSAFVTSGQRCTCARRVLVTDGPWAEPFIAKFIAKSRRLVVGVATDEPEPFMGPVVSAEQGEHVQAVQREMIAAGCKVLLELKTINGNHALLSPGVLEATGVPLGDTECFGPLTTIRRVQDLGAAIAEANATKYGLSASILTRHRAGYDTFRSKVRAGLINWNGPTTGASGKLPFGGVGRSGNHRPAGSFSVDYCAYPVASVENETLSVPATLPPGMPGA